MYGYWYSVKEHYSFSGKELKEILWTALALAFTISAYYYDLFTVGADVRIVISDTFVGFFLIASLISFFSLYAHIALQKLVGIRLGYKVTYSYWMNGIYLGLFLSIITLGKIPIVSMFILPGSVQLEHMAKLRLGKFRYGVNAKDIARVSLAGPLSHVIIITFLGMLFFASGKNAVISHLIVLNILYMMYSMLPIPKIDSPINMDGATDGLGLFFYARWVYVLCGLTFLFYSIMILAASVFSFVIALLIAALTMIIYSMTMKQTN